jgi:hypothetical protein
MSTLTLVVEEDGQSPVAAAPPWPRERESSSATSPSWGKAAEAHPEPKAVDAPTGHAAPPATRPASRWSASCDVALLAIIESPLGPDETTASGFARKEHELRRALSVLTVPEARALHARLSNPAPDDPLAKAFTRLTADRRGRLINFLADARRREACAQRRGAVHV